MTTNDRPHDAQPPPTTLVPAPGDALPQDVGGRIPQIVGIGASAGGLNAFLRIMRLLPRDTGLAYVLVQHLDPAHDSLLPQLLDRESTIPVVEATDGLRLQADHGYVIPPNTVMTVTDGHLRVVVREVRRGLHLPIDVFLRSLAEVRGSDAVGVILSGSGADGARGVEAIREAGGITMAQDAASAAFPAMPDAAAATGCVDFILSPEGIAEKLGHLGRNIGRQQGAVADTARQSARARSLEEGNQEKNDDTLRAILALLYEHSRVDFLQYRRGSLRRRILHRMLALHHESEAEYLAFLRRAPAELEILYENILIGVTSFFRDPELFEALKATILPDLLHRRPDKSAPIRVWSVGCAGGEEAYSLAMTLLEVLGDDPAAPSIQIFGTDLSEASIARARAGHYPASIARDVSEERLRRFFTAEGNGYVIAKSVRERCVFSRQNVVGDPPFSHLDLVSCRNVLIYLEQTLQRRAFGLFHFALEPHGLLVLGSAESARAAAALFEPLQEGLRVFERRPFELATVAPEGVAPPDGREPRPLSTMVATKRSPSPIRLPPPEPIDLAIAADRVLLARFTPPAVVINEALQIVHFHGDTRRFLVHSPGEASLDLLTLAHPQLVATLRAAVQRALSENVFISTPPVTIVGEPSSVTLAVAVAPLRPSSVQRHFLVLFLVNPIATPDSARARRPRRRGADGEVTTNEAVTVAREELAAAKRHLQEVIEHHEVTVEELRAAGEELQASNEELQSTNEELQTTREEVQSTNEEVTTVNDELRHRNSELAALSADLSNVLSNTKVPIAIVGADLTLRRFTPALDRVMRVTAADAGRGLSELELHFALPKMAQLVTDAATRLTVAERELQDDDGHWWRLTVTPYLTTDRRVDGAVLVFSDIDDIKRHAVQSQTFAEERQRLLNASEEALRLSEVAQAAAESANRAKADFLAHMSHDLRTPLNAIMGYADLLELGLRGPISEVQLLDLSRIKRSTRHLLAVINDILNFAKVEAGHVSMNAIDVSVATSVNGALDLLLPQLASRSLHLTRGTLVGVVRADPERMRQILLNILTNALKFTPAGGTIDVSSAQDAGHVRIVVTDTGLGIPALQLERIFDPFVQVERNDVAPQREGVGLGLAISRGLARAMDGDIDVTSRVGVGSSFTLVLPRGTNGTVALA